MWRLKSESILWVYFWQVYVNKGLVPRLSRAETKRQDMCRTGPEAGVFDPFLETNVAWLAPSKLFCISMWKIHAGGVVFVSIYTMLLRPNNEAGRLGLGSDAANATLHTADLYSTYPSCGFTTMWHRLFQPPESGWQLDQSLCLQSNWVTKPDGIF